ncbi:hypothetical protein BGZ65_001972, partial [Modicella reniformis]
MENQSLLTSSSGGIGTLGRNTTALRITEIDDNQALVVCTQGSLSKIPVQGTEKDSDQLRLEMDSTMALHEQVQAEQLQQKVQEFQETKQKTDQQIQHTLQQQVDKILQQTQQMDQQKQQVDGVVQKFEQLDQQAEQSQQQVQKYIKETVQKIQQEDQQQQQQMHQQMEHSHQQLQQRIEEAVQKTQQMDQQKQLINKILQRIKQQDQQAEQSQQQVQQYIKETVQKIQQEDQQQQQQIDEILGKTQQMHQQMEHSHQQLQQRIEEAVQKTQQMDQHKQLIDGIVQKMEQQVQQVEQSQQQMQQRVEEALQKIQQVDQQQQQQQTEKILEKAPQIDQQVQHSHQQMQPQIDEIQQRILLQVQATLNMSFQEIAVPRLFIVLPKTAATVGEQRTLRSSQFRLYFLCECGTMESVTSGTQEIHVANHAGYNMVNAKKFFDEYGTYLLTMMYMVKYGANADRLKVPPLLGLDLANEVEAGQTHLNFIKKNISRLVNDTILYLEETIGVTNGDSGASAYQKLSNLDPEQLKSYLWVKKGKPITGNLCRTTTQDGKCVWVCSEHQLEYHKSAVQSQGQMLENVITASGGSYCEEAGKVKIKITSDELAKRFYDGMVKICGIQSASNLLSPTVLELKLDCFGLIKNPTAGIISINLNGFNSLSLDFRRHSMTAVISQGEVRDVDMKIVRLGDLSLDDFEFIKQCHITHLEIQHTPQQGDEDRLVSILQHISKLKELHIE